MLLLYFCTQNKFSVVQTGGLITLYHYLLSLLLQEKSLPEIVNESTQLLSQKKQFEPDKPFDFFDKKQIVLINKYLEETIFHHYHMYRYCLLSEQDCTIISEDKTILLCPLIGTFNPPPLVEAISEHDVDIYVTNPPVEYLITEEEEEEVDGENLELAKEEEKKIPMVSLSDVQKVLDSVGSQMIDKLEKDIEHKCHEKEQQHVNRITKVKKAVH